MPAMKLLATWSLITLLVHCASSQNVIQPQNDVTLIIGRDVELQTSCSIPDRNANVQWYRDGNLVNASAGDRIIIVPISNIISRLTISNIRTSDSGRYQCEVNGDHSELSGYINVISIDITAPSPQQLIYQSNDTIECSSPNDTAAVWYTVNPKIPITSNATYSIGPEGLHITNVQLYHQQQYRCEQLLQSIHLGRSVIIDVKVLVPSMIMSEPTNVSVVKGQTLSLSFDYLAIPAPNFTWYINNNLHDEVQSTPGTNNNSHTMIFTNVNEEGWYSCIVQNELGTTEYTVFVDILLPPQVDPINTQKAAVGRSAMLQCISSGDAPISFHWSFSGSRLADGARIAGANTRTLIINDVTEDDNGMYTCTATNPYGNDSDSGSLIVIGLPRSPSDVNINDETSTTAVVTWSIATNILNHPVDYVYVNYHIMGSADVMSVRVPSSESQLILEHLIPYTTYIVNVIPNNMAGNSSNPVDRDFTTEVGVPRIHAVSCTSNSYNSIELAVTLLYIGSETVTGFHIRYRIADTTSWSTSMVHDNLTSTTWNYDLTDLPYSQQGYEVEIIAINSVGESDAIASSSPTKLFAVLPGKPNIRQPTPSSITENSTTITCYVSDVGQPLLNEFTLVIISPVERRREYVARLPSYSAGANVSIVADMLSSDTEYVFACYASSIVGDGERSDPITVRTDKPSSATIDADETSGEGKKNIGIIIGVASGILVIIILLIVILVLYACCVRKSNQNKYFVKSTPSADENVYRLSPGVMRRQFTLEQSGSMASITRHQVSDSVNSKQEGLPTIHQFSSTMSSTQEGLPSMRYSNTVTSNQGGLSSLQFSSQQSPISNGNYVPLSQQASKGFSSSCTRQLSNLTSNLNLQPGCSGSSATYPLSTDRITAHYHISGSVTSSSLYDEEDTKLSYPPSTFATVV